MDDAEFLAEGQAFTDLSFWRVIAVGGADALEWLNDLVSADLSGLVPGAARRTLLLSPTGRIRAEFTVAMAGDEILLIQDPSQPSNLGELLDRYVLSSDVRLTDRTDRTSLFAMPGLTEHLSVPGADTVQPSCLGSGVDLVAPGEDHERLMATLSERMRLVGGEVVERWRVLAGRPRFGVDATVEDLPSEAAMEDLIAFDKGCYLGQESVAKVRNLGHPRRLVMAFEANGAVAAGDTVLTGQSEVGQVTSAAETAEGSVGLARVAWDARASDLRTATGTALRLRTVAVP